MFFLMPMKLKTVNEWNVLPLSQPLQGIILTILGVLKWRKIIFHGRHFKPHNNMLVLTLGIAVWKKKLLWSRKIFFCLKVTRMSCNSGKLLKVVFDFSPKIEAVIEPWNLTPLKIFIRCVTDLPKTKVTSLKVVLSFF